MVFYIGGYSASKSASINGLFRTEHHFETIVNPTIGSHTDNTENDSFLAGGLFNLSAKCGIYHTEDVELNSKATTISSQY